MIVELQIPAPDGARFARGTFDGQVGKQVKFVGKKATMLSAKVSLNGSKARVRLDVPLIDLTEYYE